MEMNPFAQLFVQLTPDVGFMHLLAQGERASRSPDVDDDRSASLHRFIPPPLDENAPRANLAGRTASPSSESEAGDPQEVVAENSISVSVEGEGSAGQQELVVVVAHEAPPQNGTERFFERRLPGLILDIMATAGRSMIAVAGGMDFSSFSTLVGSPRNSAG